MAHVVKIRILFFVFSVMVLSGCAIGGAVEISEPTIIGALPADVKLDSSGIVRKGDLSLSIKPQNARVPILFIGPLLPLLPIGPGNEVGKNKPFKVIIQFEVVSSGYTFNPSSVKLYFADSAYSPVKAWGPLTQTNKALEIARASPGHNWVCTDADRNRENVDTSVAVPPKSCFVLEFPITTLTPAEGFQVELRGLSNEGNEITLPRIDFRSGHWAGLSILGN
jgi:hypothetical protein